MPRYYIRVIGIFIIIGALWGGANFALSAVTSTPEIEALNRQIAAQKEKIKALEQTMATYQKTIDQKQTEGVSLKNQLTILDAQTKQFAADIDLTQQKINQTELEISALTFAITDKSAVLDRQKAIVKKLVQTLNVDSRRTSFEVLIAYTNFADFYANLTSLEYLYRDLGRSVTALRLAKEDLDAKKTQVTERRQHYNDLKNDLENKKNKLLAQTGYKARLLTETKGKEQEYRALLASLKKQYQIVENDERTYEEKLRAKLAAEDKLKPVGDVAFAWPVPSHVINALFHDPNYPFRNVFQHNGLDIKASYGTAIRAVAPGYVARARRCTLASCYAYVMILHTVNLTTVYGHMSQINVDQDQFINRGDIIGYSGGTPGTVGAGPFVTGPHLHFEVRVNGIPVDPLGYLVQ